ncbi:MAG: heme ABC transporter permease CcmC [Alphaproteobacteria bacterium]|nr:heme ABC transporter permease CcmC [Alphaproteobacteria bacterium]MDE2042991.1 heme ABC transporter permease CcmC [Alphaproteobacteria bacterium]MDE2340046.1 heme ABC transporter permease CcmC [Alphaproteobacteria bacterium]
MHAFANPARFLKLARPLTPWCLGLGLALIGYGIYAGFQSPPDAVQGETVRILYIHVPTAWLGMLGWMGIALTSLMLLVWRHPLAAVAARAIAVPGALFTAVCLISGSIWGRPTWGTWWQWDGRMTSMLLLLFLYLAYIALAGSESETSSTERVAAIFGLVGAVNLPVIHYSVVWWNTLHQPPSLSLQGSAIAWPILWPLLWTTPGFTLLFAGIVLMRMRTLIAENKKLARMRRLARA